MDEQQARQILGLDDSPLTLQELRRARNSALRAHHPDTVGTDASDIRRATYWSTQINTAHDLLAAPLLERRSGDETGDAARQSFTRPRGGQPSKQPPIRNARGLPTRLALRPRPRLEQARRAEQEAAEAQARSAAQARVAAQERADAEAGRRHDTQPVDAGWDPKQFRADPRSSQPGPVPIAGRSSGRQTHSCSHSSWAASRLWWPCLGWSPPDPGAWTLRPFPRSRARHRPNHRAVVDSASVSRSGGWSISQKDEYDQHHRPVHPWTPGCDRMAGRLRRWVGLCHPSRSTSGAALLRDNDALQFGTQYICPEERGSLYALAVLIRPRLTLPPVLSQASQQIRDGRERRSSTLSSAIRRHRPPIGSHGRRSSQRLAARTP